MHNHGNHFENNISPFRKNETPFQNSFRVKESLCILESLFFEYPQHNMFWLKNRKISFYYKVSKVAKIRNRYNQVPHLTQDTYGKVTNSQKTPQTRA